MNVISLSPLALQTSSWAKSPGSQDISRMQHTIDTISKQGEALTREVSEIRVNRMLDYFAGIEAISSTTGNSQCNEGRVSCYVHGLQAVNRLNQPL